MKWEIPILNFWLIIRGELKLKEKTFLMDVKSWLKIVEKKIIGNLHIHPQKFSLLVAEIEWNSRKKGSTAWQIKPNEFYKVCFRKWVNGTLIHLLTLSTYISICYTQKHHSE